MSSIEDNFSVNCRMPTEDVTIGEFLNRTNVNILTFENNGKNIINVLPSSFAYCTNLTGIDLLSSTVETIENNVFLNCQSLLSIEFPSTLTALGENSFLGCETLNQNGMIIPETVVAIYGPIGITTFNSVPN